MISDTVASGELYFRLFLEDERKQQNCDVKLPSGMKSFLKRRDDPNKDILNTRQRVIQVLLSRLEYINSSVPVIRGFNNTTKLRIAREKLLLKSLLETKGQEFDTCALQSILQYAAVLQQEILDAQKSLVQERAMKEVLKDQARISRDLLVFSAHLTLETKARIELHHLSSSTAQYVRCVKAVHDNLHNCFGFNQHSPMIPDPENVGILNIFKLKNTVLARNLQKATAKATGAKMKGLFCCMPIDNIYRFAVNGLREQSLPASIPKYGPDPAIKECFGTPWIFCNREKPLAPISGELRKTLANAGFATKCIENAAVECPVLRFSKYSTVSTMLSYSEPQLQQGLCLALCRVLIMRLKTVQSFIEDIDIVNAFQQGYDAVYSSKTEEYALLQPQFVLPEFFIHTNFTSLQQPSEILASSTSPSKTSSSSAKQVSSAVLPSYLRVNLHDSNITSTDSSRPLVSSLATATSAWAHSQPAQCPQHVLLSNHCESIAVDYLPSAIRNNSPSMKMYSNFNMLHQSSSHRYIMIKQGSLQAIESAVGDFRHTLIASKLAMAKRLLQWCSAEQKRTAAVVIQRLQQQLNYRSNPSSSSAMTSNASQRKLFLSETGASETDKKTSQSQLQTAVPSSSSPKKARSAEEQQRQKKKTSAPRTDIEAVEDDGLMTMVTEAMNAAQFHHHYNGAAGSSDRTMVSGDDLGEEVVEDSGLNDDDNDNDDGAYYEDDYEAEVGEIDDM